MTTALPAAPVSPALDSRSVAVRLGGREVLAGADLVLRPGEMVAVVGPNGAGKTTWLRALAGILPLDGGEVRAGGAPLPTLSRRELARRLAFLPQETWTEFGITVADAVAMGRFAHLGALRPPGDADRRAVRDAMERADVASLAARPLTQLSAGERRRVHLARAIAQEASILVLDEPTTALDVGHACQVMDLLAALARGGAAVVLSLHDLVLAMRGPTRALLLDGGRVAAEGPPVEVLTSPAAQRAFGMPLVAIGSPPVIVPGTATDLR
jgi:iron complex transport system ATP-binding protein